MHRRHFWLPLDEEIDSRQSPDQSHELPGTFEEHNAPHRLYDGKVAGELYRIAKTLLRVYQQRFAAEGRAIPPGLRELPDG